MAKQPTLILIFVLAIGLMAATGADKVHALLRPLLDLSIDNKEAINQVSHGVLTALNLPDSEENKDVWVKLLTKEQVHLGQGELVPDRSAFDVLSEELDHQVEAIKSEVGEAKDTFRAVAERVVRQHVEKAGALLRQSINSRLPGLCQSREHEDTELVIDRSMADQFPEHLFGVLDQVDQDLGVVSTEEEINELVDLFVNAFDDLLDEEMDKAHSVLSFCRFPKDLLLITGQALLAQVQEEVHVPVAQRASRLAHLCQLLTMLQDEDGSFEHVHLFVNELSLAHQKLVKSPAQCPADFQEVLAAAIGDFLPHIDARVSSEAAFKWAKQLLTRPMLSNADHVALFMKGHVDRRHLPLLSSNAPVNSRANLFAVEYLVATDFKDVHKEWLTATLQHMRVLLRMDHQLLRTWSSMSVMLHEDVANRLNSDEFMDLVHQVVLDFLDSNGLKVDDGNWNVFLDQFINAFYSENYRPVVGSYFPLKVLNAHFYTDLPHFDLQFLSFVPDEESVGMLSRLLEQDNFKMLRAIAWNAHKSVTKDDSAETLRSGKYLLTFNNAAVSSEHFQKAGVSQAQLKSNQQRPPRPANYGKIIITFAGSKGRSGQEGPSEADTRERPAQEHPDLHEEDESEEGQARQHKIVVNGLTRSPKRHFSLSRSDLDESVTEYEEHLDNFRSSESVEVEDLAEMSPALRRSVSLVEESKKRTDRLRETIEEIFDKEGGRPNEKGQSTLVILGELQPELEKLIGQADLEELLRLQNVFGDDSGQETEVVLVKFVPKNSDCHEKVFGARK